MLGPFIEIEKPVKDDDSPNTQDTKIQKITEGLIKQLDSIEQKVQSLALEQKSQRSTIAPIGTIVGPSGSGKTALIQHWTRTREERETCNPQFFPLYIPMESKKGSLPIFYSLYIAVQETLLRAAGRGYKLKHRDEGKKYKTFSYRNAELLRQDIEELLEQLPIIALIIDNAHYLDKHAIEEAITFRYYKNPKHGLQPRRALILIAEEEENKKLQLLEHLKKIGDANAAWSHRVSMQFLDEAEFVHVFFMMVHVNLSAEFGSKLDIKKAIVEWHKLTRGDWWNIVILANELHDELSFSQGRRLVTKELLDRVKRKLTNGRLR